jgi:hypothetical protein
MMFLLLICAAGATSFVVVRGLILTPKIMQPIRGKVGRLLAAVPAMRDRHVGRGGATILTGQITELEMIQRITFAISLVVPSLPVVAETISASWKKRLANE